MWPRLERLLPQTLCWREVTGASDACPPAPPRPSGPSPAGYKAGISCGTVSAPPLDQEAAPVGPIADRDEASHPESLSSWRRDLVPERRRDLRSNWAKESSR